MNAGDPFKKLLTEAIYLIKSQEDVSIKSIQVDLGHLIDRSPSLIEHWRKGNIPHLFSDLEKVAEYLVKRANLDDKWLLSFLQSGQHPAPTKFVAQLFPHSSQPPPPLFSEECPDVAPLPPTSHMPLEQNPHFIGRTDELQDIARHFSKHEQLAPTSRTVAICGLGGVGKTQLASEFTHRFGQFFPGGVFWLNFDAPDRIAAQVAKCGGPGILNLLNYHELSLDDQIQLVRAAWQQPIRRLLIFDNCEDETLVKQWRPITGGCSVLMTSRRMEWEPSLGVKTVPLSVLYRYQSAALLKQHLDEPEDSYLPILDEIAAEVGDLPLALHMAGRYMRRYQRVMTPEAYLGRLKSPDLLKHTSLTSGGYSPTHHEEHVWRTFALSYDQLNPAYDNDQYALGLLTRAAHFAPGELIWIELLRKTFDEDVEPDVLAIKVEQGFSRLLELGLIEADANYSMRMHRLVAAFVRDVAASEVEETKRLIQEAVLKETARINKNGLPLPLLAWQVHLQSIVDLENPEQDSRHAALCNEIGEHFKQMREPKQALPYFETAVSILENLQPADSAEKSKAYHNLGWTLRELSWFEKSKQFLNEALQLRMDQFGTDHPATAESFNELGRWYLSQGEYGEAQTFFAKAIKLCKSELPANHPLTADFLNNLGMCLAFAKRYEEGLAYVMEALEIREKRFGFNHPRTALSYNNAGYILRDLENYQMAEIQHEKALAVRRTIFGYLNSDTAQSYINLGDIYLQQKQLPLAKKMLHTALDIYTKMEEDRHLNVASCCYNLSVIAEMDGELRESLEFVQRTESIRIEKLGSAHPRTKRAAERVEAIKKKINQLPPDDD